MLVFTWRGIKIIQRAFLSKWQASAVGRASLALPNVGTVGMVNKISSQNCIAKAGRSLLEAVPGTSPSTSSRQ